MILTQTITTMRFLANLRLKIIIMQKYEQCQTFPQCDLCLNCGKVEKKITHLYILFQILNSEFLTKIEESTDEVNKK